MDVVIQVYIALLFVGTSSLCQTVFTILIEQTSAVFSATMLLCKFCMKLHLSVQFSLHILTNVWLNFYLIIGSLTLHYFLHTFCCVQKCDSFFLFAGIQVVISAESNNVLYSSPVCETKKGCSSFHIHVDESVRLQGDVKVQFYNKPKMMRKVQNLSCGYVLSLAINNIFHAKKSFTQSLVSQ